LETSRFIGRNDSLFSLNIDRYLIIDKAERLINFKPVMIKPKDFDEYLKGFPIEIQQLLEQVRLIIKDAAPQAKEVISYGMPAFKMNGMLVWFAAHSKHIGFYPGASGIKAFEKELSDYKWAKGSVQFPFDKPLPSGFISEIVKFRLNENLNRARTKKK
jgi:uncharacterized protein YdhG (YjbR/CyaY superfamily)